jgi:hypothetical protein
MKIVLLATMVAVVCTGNAFALGGVNGTSLNLSGVNGPGLNSPPAADLNSLHVLRAALRH